ncbi:translation initiation factor IF-2-like [Meles meles]|uniref:translation initiation factor IF-2-like n=1 Tax=Meles meles TaxID=9662 RepID=UPI001E69DC6A|nr:translation initiation factor IF-2-like [Meles meles]
MTGRGADVSLLTLLAQAPPTATCRPPRPPPQEGGQSGCACLSECGEAGVQARRQGPTQAVNCSPGRSPCPHQNRPSVVAGRHLGSCEKSQDTEARRSVSASAGAAPHRNVRPVSAGDLGPSGNSDPENTYHQGLTLSGDSCVGGTGMSPPGGAGEPASTPKEVGGGGGCRGCPRGLSRLRLQPEEGERPASRRPGAGCGG